jgi:hypothetical protein
MSAKPGLRRRDAGKRRPRHRVVYQHPRKPPPDPVEQALQRPMFWGEDVTPAQWERLRAPCWERWLDSQESPPHAARIDGIRGDALRAFFNPPSGYVNNWDARPKIVELAEEGLAELARFRKANPTAARSIKQPLTVYEGLLEAVRERPELRLLD